MEQNVEKNESVETKGIELIKPSEAISVLKAAFERAGWEFEDREEESFYKTHGTAD